MAATHTLQDWTDGPPPVRDDGALATIELRQDVLIDGQPNNGDPIVVSRWDSKLKTTAGHHRLEYADVIRHIDIAAT